MFRPLLVGLDGADALDAAMRSGADALVLDLGDAMAPGDRAARRRAALDILAALRGPSPPAFSAGDRPGAALPRLIVRVAPLAGGPVDADLDAVMRGAPDAVLLPGAVGRADVQHLAAKLAVHEAENGLLAGRTGIVAAPADTAAGVLALGTLPDAGPRLRALVWDAAALAADLGVETAASPVRTARSLLLLAAAAARVPALDRSLPGEHAARARRAARRDGFTARIALRPEEVGAAAGAPARSDP